MTDGLLNDQTAVLLTNGQQAPSWMSSWWSRESLAPILLNDPAGLVTVVLRSRPRAIVLDARGDSGWQSAVLASCRRLKRDSYTGIVPIVLVVPQERCA
ncbi:MAG: hypothetical protein IT353_20640, partial [Gemmatimonadaceae bacterium]|nr:hypothetical protein [Gemmatimonadaceae bacterium]